MVDEFLIVNRADEQIYNEIINSKFQKIILERKDINFFFLSDKKDKYTGEVNYKSLNPVESIRSSIALVTRLEAYSRSTNFNQFIAEVNTTIQHGLDYKKFLEFLGKCKTTVESNCYKKIL